MNNQIDTTSLVFQLKELVDNRETNNIKMVDLMYHIIEILDATSMNQVTLDTTITNLYSRITALESSVHAMNKYITDVDIKVSRLHTHEHKIEDISGLVQKLNKFGLSPEQKETLTKLIKKVNNMDGKVQWMWGLISEKERK